MLNNDDDADTAHKARKDRVGNIADIFAYLDDAEEYLEQAAEQACQRHADKHGSKIAARAGPGPCHEGGGDHGHRAGRSANLTVCAAKE